MPRKTKQLVIDDKKFVNTDGIDLSSGVEELRGIKSNRKINNLFKKINDN